MFSFNINKPSNLNLTITNINQRIVETGGVFEGDEKSGYILSDGIEGNYHVNIDSIKIDITKRPPFIFNKMIERYIRRVFNECSA